MAGGFDAGQALRGGVGDRRQAWEFIRRFAAAWATPLAPGDGVSRDAWRAAEDRIGAELPAALREAYLLFGRRPDLTARQDRLVSPHRLSLDESGTTVVFRVENQHCASWGVAVSDLASADPPVCIQDRAGGGWEPFLDRVSVACVEMVLSEVLLGCEHLGDMCELHEGLISTVESAYAQMAVPEYRLWADRSITVRWFSAPGKLMRMDGADHAAGCWRARRPRPTWKPSGQLFPSPGPAFSGQAGNLGNLRHMAESCPGRVGLLLRCQPAATPARGQVASGPRSSGW